jgi:tetratricopeptide (TPR) repeat protein
MKFLVYAYMQSGREAEAQAIVDEIKAMPAKRDDMYGADYDPRTDALSLLPARIALELHRWQDAAALQPVAGAMSGDLMRTYWARAIGAARSGNVAEARKNVAEIEAIHTKLLGQKKPSFAEVVEDSRQEAMAWVNHAEGNNADALKTLRGLAEKEESEGNEVGDIPAREMLAEVLMEMNRPEQALTEYETDLKFNPGRFNGLYEAAHAAQLAHQDDKANAYFAQLVKSCEGSNSSRPELAQAKQLLASK